MKGLRKMLILLALAGCFVFAGCGAAEIVQESTPEATEATIPDSEKLVMPNPEVFFGTVQKGSADVSTKLIQTIQLCDFPTEAMNDYVQLLSQNYPLTMEIVYAIMDIGAKNAIAYKFYDENTGEQVLYISWLGEAPEIIVLFQYSDSCRLEEKEVWAGDIGEYEYDPAEWTDCQVCSGYDKCSTCYGTGTIDIGDGYDILRKTCPDCQGGECGYCYRGKVRVSD